MFESVFFFASFSMLYVTYSREKRNTNSKLIPNEIARLVSVAHFVLALCRR